MMHCNKNTTLKMKCSFVLIDKLWPRDVNKSTVISMFLIILITMLTVKDCLNQTQDSLLCDSGFAVSSDKIQ